MSIINRKTQDLRDNREINTSYWLGTDDIDTIVKSITNQKGISESTDNYRYNNCEYHLVDSCQYLLKDRFPISSENLEIKGLVAILPPTDGKLDNHCSITGIPYYLCKDYSIEAPIDAFDEIFANITENDHVRILSPHNISDNHWGCSEINIRKEGIKFFVECFFHNPCGNGEINNHSQTNLSNAIIESISSRYLNAEINIEYKKSPYEKRQVDSSSCGIHTIVDMFDRVQGIEPSQKLGCGAKEKRAEFLNLVKLYNPDQYERFAARNIRHKTLGKYIYSDSNSIDLSTPSDTYDIYNIKNIVKLQAQIFLNSYVEKLAQIVLCTQALPTLLMSYILNTLNTIFFKKIDYIKEVKTSLNSFSYDKNSISHTTNLDRNDIKQRVR